MRFYPFGSGSIPPSVTSSSLAEYAINTRYALFAVSSSVALSGSVGPTGVLNINQCVLASGSSGSTGVTGPQGPPGTVSGPF